MTRITPDFDQRIADWLEGEPDRAPSQVAGTVLAALPSVRQRRRRYAFGGGRTRPMPTPTRFAMIAAGLVVAASGLVVVASGLGYLGSGGSAPIATSSPSPKPSSTASPSTSPLPSTATGPIDTTAWTPYTSSRYDFSVGHPPDWTAIPASRDWTFETDVEDPLSPGHDAFYAPYDSIRVSVWNAPFDAATSIDSIADIVAWVEDYCQASTTRPCTGIEDRAVELCLERWDCHPGLLVPFFGSVQAFFSGGIYDGRSMTVVAVWWAESAQAVRPHGGSQRLLEAFLSTMQVWPASTPVSERRTPPPSAPG